MDFKTIIDLISKSNIDNDKIYELVREASSLDLNDEENLRMVIRKGCSLADRSISLEQEDRIISLLKEKGISSDLFSLIR